MKGFSGDDSIKIFNSIRIKKKGFNFNVIL